MHYLLRIKDKLRRDRETKDWTLTIEIHARTVETDWETISTFDLPGFNSRKAAKKVRKMALNILTSTMMNRVYHCAVGDTVQDFKDAIRKRLNEE